MQPSYRQFSANNISLRAGQLQHDNMLPAEDMRAEAIDAKCHEYAERLCGDEMDAAELFEAYDAFAGETLAGFLADDNDAELLQLVLKRRDDPLAKAIINRLYEAACKHMEGKLK